MIALLAAAFVIAIGCAVTVVLVLVELMRTIRTSRSTAHTHEPVRPKVPHHEVSSPWTPEFTTAPIAEEIHR